MGTTTCRRTLTPVMNPSHSHKRNRRESSCTLSISCETKLIMNFWREYLLKTRGRGKHESTVDLGIIWDHISILSRLDVDAKVVKNSEAQLKLHFQGRGADFVTIERNVTTGVKVVFGYEFMNATYEHTLRSDWAGITSWAYTRNDKPGGVGLWTCPTFVPPTIKVQ